MEDRLPFARGEARLQLLYELPRAGDEQRVLVIGTEPSVSVALSADQQRRLSTIQFMPPAGGAPTASGFDVVLVPGSLFQYPDESAATLLSRALQALAPGGVVVGHCDNLTSVRALGSACRSLTLLSSVRNRQQAGSPARLAQTLQSLGFVDAECFHVEPHIASPMALIPAEPRASRSHFVRTVLRNRPLYGSLGFALRLALARAGLGGILQPHLFFWARKPC